MTVLALLHGFVVGAPVLPRAQAPAGDSEQQSGPSVTVRWPAARDARAEHRAEHDLAAEGADVIVGDDRVVIERSDPDGSSMRVRWPGFISAQASCAEQRWTLEFGVPSPHAASALPLLVSSGVAAISHRAGYLVLHATAVALDGRVHLFAAPRGGGKTAVAAMACFGGALLHGEDVAAIRVDGAGRALVALGAQELRLRRTSKSEALVTHLELAGHGEGWEPRTSHPDGRSVVRPPQSQQDWLPLGGVHEVSLGRVADRPQLVALNGAGAVASVLAARRCVGPSDPRVEQAHFSIAASVVSDVHCGRLVVPWGDPVRTASFVRPMVEQLRGIR